MLFVRTKALLSESLKETLDGAGRDRRLTCGLDNCGQLLQMYVVLCLHNLHFDFGKVSLVQLCCFVIL